MNVSGTFASLASMEDRVVRLIAIAKGKRTIHPFDLPLVMGVARKGIAQHGSDDTAVLNIIEAFLKNIDDAHRPFQSASVFFEA